MDTVSFSLQNVVDFTIAIARTIFLVEK
jgi:hypothetical protein